MAEAQAKEGAIVPVSLGFLGLRLRLAFAKRRFDEVESVYRSHVDDECEQARLAAQLGVFDASFSSLRKEILAIEQGQEIIKKKILPRVVAQVNMHESFLVFLQGFHMDNRIRVRQWDDDDDDEDDDDDDCEVDTIDNETFTPDNGEAEGGERNNQKCHLPMLNLGDETSTEIKKKIAEFAGIPTGGSLHDLRSLVAMMGRGGFASQPEERTVDSRPLSRTLPEAGA